MSKRIAGAVAQHTSASFKTDYYPMAGRKYASVQLTIPTQGISGAFSIEATNWDPEAATDARWVRVPLEDDSGDLAQYVQVTGSSEINQRYVIRDEACSALRGSWDYNDGSVQGTYMTLIFASRR